MRASWVPSGRDVTVLRLGRILRDRVAAERPENLPHDVPRIPSAPEVVMEAARGLVGGAASENGETPAAGVPRPRQLVRVREGAGDGGLGERARDAAGLELLAQPLTSDGPAPGPGPGPGEGEGAIVHVSPRLEVRHNRLRDLGRRAAAAEAAREVPAGPGFPGEEIERGRARLPRVQRPARHRPDAERGHRGTWPRARSAVRPR